MPLDTATVGANQRPINVIGDPLTAVNQLSIAQKHSADAQAIDNSIYSLVAASVKMLLNAGGTFDRQRSAVGTTGIPAVNTEGTKTTVSWAALGFTPAATATDFAAITGSGTKTVRITRLVITGIATAATPVAVQLIKRSTANTGGTPTTVTAVVHDSNDAATATLVTYAANPTTGTLVGNVRAEYLNLGAASGGAAGQIVFDFTTRNGKGIVLRGTAQQLCLNWNGAAVPAGTVLTIEAEATEE